MSTINATNRRGMATVLEAAEFLSVSRSTAYDLMDRKLLAWVQVAGCRRIPWSALEEFVSKNTHPAEEE